MKRQKMSRGDGCLTLDAYGLPCLTPAQVARVQRYAADMVIGGSSRLHVSPLLMSAALLELSAHCVNVQHKLEQFIEGTATAAPAGAVAKLALSLLMRLQALPTAAERDAFLQMLMGDVEGDDSSSDPEAPAAPTKRHH